ncbi:V-type proton ATPase 116 kDa subunit a 2-like [Petromyzon marinus]|uniref:V-type proton ATPase subunit a n=1 Tax=Petromyzon marinus TaxID=7757 RepID=A0AAJ7SPW6_PETMA|nr:V-type proton ATPase 116 kDa subunit a-like [Petromyzon marinus]
MGSIFRSEEMCLAQLFLQDGTAYSCMSELGEMGLVEFRDLNAQVSAFQRKHVADIRRCEDMEKILNYIEKEITKAGIVLPLTSGNPRAPLARDLLQIQTESEKLEGDLREVSRNQDTLRRNRLELEEYSHVLRISETFRDQSEEQIIEQAPSEYEEFPSVEKEPLVNSGLVQRLGARLSFIAGVVHPCKVAALERMLWRACRGYMVFHQMQIPEPLEDPDSGENVNWCVILVSYWGEQIGNKVRMICECYHCHLYPYPDTQKERRDLLMGLFTRIEDIKVVLLRTDDYLRQMLLKAVDNISTWQLQVRKTKAIYHALNLCRYDVTNRCLIAEVWCPTADLAGLQDVLRQVSIQGGASLPSFLTRIPTRESPPTLLRTNKLTGGFQGIVDAYGVGSYREVNPALYTIITFPFLFAVMFGDLGHGILMLLFALAMVLMEKRLAPKAAESEIFGIFFQGRYIVLLMGLFSIYTGLIYNDCFSKSINLFSSSWNVTAMYSSGPWTTEVVRANKLLSLDPKVEGVFSGPYPFGIDPIWNLAANRLTFLNSYKMKMSIILGMVHMTFGVILSVFNHRFFRRPLDIWLVFIPEMVFMLFLFGYLVLMVLYKWCAWGVDDAQTAPSILIIFINMFLFRPSSREKGGPGLLFAGQEGLQYFLMVVALLMVPLLLLGKPYVLYRKHMVQARHGANSRRDGSSQRIRRYQEEEYIPLINETDEVTVSMLMPDEDTEPGADAGTDTGAEKFDTGDTFMHQAIHTIEYCLGCISNTASYLRLWALSLAHAELSEVLWNMVMRTGLKLPSSAGGPLLLPVFGFFGTLTVVILLFMEGLSAFLHALRLHWVEFQNKFYSGMGYKFAPFSFTTILLRTRHA